MAGGRFVAYQSPSYRRSIGGVPVLVHIVVGARVRGVRGAAKFRTACPSWALRRESLLGAIEPAGLRCSSRAGKLGTMLGADWRAALMIAMILDHRRETRPQRRRGVAAADGAVVLDEDTTDDKRGGTIGQPVHELISSTTRSARLVAFKKRRRAARDGRARSAREWFLDRTRRHLVSVSSVGEHLLPRLRRRPSHARGFYDEMPQGGWQTAGESLRLRAPGSRWDDAEQTPRAFHEELRAAAAGR